MESSVEATTGDVEPAGEETRAYASWGQRFAAVVVDGLITTILSAIAVAVVVALTGTFSDIAEGLETETEADDDAFVIAYLGWYFGWALLGAVYSTYFHGKSGQTPGKMMLAIRVRGDHRDGRIGYGRAFARWFMAGLFWSLLTVPGVLDALWPLWDAKKQTWHDKIANSVVVRA